MKWLSNESAFGRICTFLGTIIMANLMFVVTLVPVVTAGAGLCALYYTMLKLVRYREVNPFAEFFEGFKDNFKQATAAWLAVLALGVFFLIDLRICSFMAGGLQYCALVIFAALLACTIIAVYLFPVIAAFHGTLRALIKYSVCFAGSNLLYVLLTVCISVLPMLLTYVNINMLPLTAFLWCTVGFAGTTLLNSYFFFRLFRKHLIPTTEEQQCADEKKILEEMRKLEGS